MTRLSAQRALLAGYHNAQGRVIALLRLVQLGADDVLAVLPRELVAPVAARLGKFVLRAKVRLQDESAQWSHRGRARQRRAGHRGAGAGPRGARRGAARRRHAHRALLRCAGALPPDPARGRARDARRTGAARARGLAAGAAIAAGEPQVYAATSEEFVAQMLNLDVLDAIAFDKGCYTGQEVIARAHYRGRVKRRMQRFLTRAARELRPGDAGTLADGRAFKVVEAVRGTDGQVEFLAVTGLAADPAAAPDAAAEPLAASALPLPYELPQ